MKTVMGFGGFAILAVMYYNNPFQDERKAEVRILDHQAIFAMEYQGQFENEQPLEETNWADFNAYRWAIAQLESGQNYRAVSPVNKGGQRAYGKYQILGGNVRRWAGMDPQEFMNSPETQERVFQEQATICFNTYHSWDDCASMWFSGRPAKNNNASDITGTTVPRYIQITRGNMRKYLSKQGDATRLAYIPSGERIQPSQAYRFPGLGTAATDALMEHCHQFGCPKGGINNPGVKYLRTLPDGTHVVFISELHTNGGPHTGMSSFMP